MKTPLLVALATVLLAGCAPDRQAPAAATTEPASKSDSKSGAATPKPGEAPVAGPGARSDQGKPPTPAIQPVVHVDAPGAAKLLAAEPGVVILDVRTPGEFAAGRLKGAINIDFQGPDFAGKLEALDRSKKYLVHCQSGGRSTSALATFEKLGFAQVVHLDGGMRDWLKADQPVEK